MVDGAYLALLYRGPDGTYKIVQGVDQLPEGRSPKDCSPITYLELFYLVCYHWAGSIPSATSRYPIATERSIAMLRTRLMSTTRWESRERLGDDWEIESGRKAPHFPVAGLPSFDALAVHPTREKNYGADHDGDMMGYVPAMTTESRAEAEELFSDFSYYVSTSGTSLINLTTDTLDYVFYNLTGGLQRT